MSFATIRVAAFLASTVFAAPAALAQSPVLVPAPVEKVFAPLGFDDNDNVELILHGHFPSTCYKVGPATASIDESTGRVVVKAEAYRYLGVGCAALMVPFTQSVKFGTVAVNTYKVEVVDRPDAVTTDLVVVPARSPDPDDYLYAPVQEVDLVATAGDARRGAYQVALKGRFPMMLQGCMVLREIRETLTPGDVLVVQPIAAIVDGPECDPSVYSYDFSATKTVAGTLSASELLVHVRVLNGESLNRLFDLADLRR
jgi:hypothetical protein